VACATKKVERGVLVSENLGGWMNEIKQDNIAENAIKSFEIGADKTPKAFRLFWR